MGPPSAPLLNGHTHRGGGGRWGGQHRAALVPTSTCRGEREARSRRRHGAMPKRRNHPWGKAHHPPLSPPFPSSYDCCPEPPSCSAETGPQPRLRNAAPLRDARLGATPHLAVHWQCGGGSLWRPHSLLLTAGGALRQRPRTMQVGRARVWSGTPQPPPHSKESPQAVRQWPYTMQVGRTRV